MNQKLIEFSKKKLGRIEVIMNQYNRSFNIDQYHELRVEIKKLKLILNIIKESGTRFKNNKHLNQLMMLFKQAGKIRELDLLIVRLKSFKTIKKTTLLQLEISKALKKEKLYFFKLKANPINFKKIKKTVSAKIKNLQSIKAYPIALKNKLIKDIKIWEKYNSKNNAKNSITISKLHQTRIHLKYWINYLKIFKQDLPKNQFVAMEELALKLGEWHDYIEFKKHLNKFLQNPIILKGSIDDTLFILLKNQQQIELYEMEINKKIKEIDWINDIIKK